MKSQMKKINRRFGIAAVVGIIMIVLVVWFVRRDYFYIRYTNERDGFTMKYPAAWTVQENVSGTSVIFSSLQEGDLDLFRENVNIVVQNLAGSIITLEEYSSLAIRQITLIFKDKIQMLESEPTGLGGSRGHRIVYLGKEEGETDMKIMHVWTVKGNRAYQFTYTTFESQYDKYWGKVQAMLNSFKIQ